MYKLPIVALFLIVAMPLQAMESKEIKFLQQGRDYLAKENYQKAAKAYEAAARVEPRGVEALLGMGISYLKLGDNGSSVNPEFLNQAESALKRALEIDPSQAAARVSSRDSLPGTGQGERGGQAAGTAETARPGDGKETVGTNCRV